MPSGPVICQLYIHMILGIILMVYLWPRNRTVYSESNLLRLLRVATSSALLFILVRLSSARFRCVQ